MGVNQSLDHSLINLNQLRYNGVIVNDNPFDHDKRLSIYDVESETTITLKSKGTIIFTNTRTPTQQELCECKHIVLTSDETWNPSSIQLAIVSATNSFPEDVLSIEFKFFDQYIGGL